jgi:hypothetical protein
MENPNAFQIASTFVIGVIALAIWHFTSKKPPAGTLTSKTILSWSFLHPAD